jgi:acetyltransferase-like isoleucine patch superfamily enzyme
MLQTHLVELMRFLGMWAPSQSIRIAMYRKAGIKIGNVHAIGSGVWLDNNFKNMISIEDKVHLSGNIRILSHSYILAGHEKEGISPVIIKRGASIGNNVLILAGVTIGENTVVGAGAVVVNNIPPNCLAVGVPAKPVRYFNSNKMLREKDDRMSLKLPLFVKCKTCEMEFWSEIRCDEQTFRTLDLRGNCHLCPNKHKNRYNKKDYYYIDIMKRVIGLCSEWKEGKKDHWIAKLAESTFVSTKKMREDYLEPLITKGILENGSEDTIRFVGLPNGIKI